MQFDIVVIGSGPGGYVAAIRAAQLGKKVAIIERENLGGICLNWGCIPTKALLKSAQVFDYLQHAEDYGIEAPKGTANFTKIVKRSRDVADGMSKGIQFLMRKNKITVVIGTAFINLDKSITITKADNTTEIVRAPHIIIATGGRAKELPNLKIDGKKIIGYRQAMTLEKIPNSMVVVGGGAIGVEFAYFYQTLGCAVTLVEFLEQGLLPREDVDVSKELTKILSKKGMTILANNAVQSVESKGDGCVVKVKDNKSGNEIIIECDIVLSAAGVSPNTENLGLEALNIKIDKGLIQVDQFCKTNVEGIYAIGDVIPTQALAHVASAEGILCVEKIAGHHPEPIDYGNIPSCTYCIPEVASVGLTEEGAKAAGYEIKVGKFPFSASGKASAAGTKEGFVKVIYDAKYGEWLGAHFIGANVTEMIAEVIVARKLEATGHDILKAIHPHPTMSEAIMEATAAAYGEVIHL